METKKETAPMFRVSGVRSTASISGHPVHPIFIVFPIAFLIALPFIDGLYILTGNTCWAQTALWVSGAGFVMGITAAVFGLIDFATIRRARAGYIGWVHAIGNAIAMLLTLSNWILRVGNPLESVVPVGISLSIATALVLVVTGWMGGELTFRSAIGVTGHGREVVHAGTKEGGSG
ncbi:MAG TPA: DUF2231 domain-containing protein [Chitinispirillaceae bacterium]|jgi:uncharacterized membrane protein|nr:DUF2231 domain-containing protein [Chitinispirillaceae bacterium]